MVSQMLARVRAGPLVKQLSKRPIVTPPRPSLIAAPLRLEQHIARRSITNATKPDYIGALTSLCRTQDKPGGWAPINFHSSGEVKWSVIRLQPGGGQVPAHFHHKVWDYFVPLEGEAVIEIKTKDGDGKEFEMKSGSFLAVGPEDVHCVRNKSKENEFVFLIAQAPRGSYDYVPTGPIDYVFKG